MIDLTLPGQFNANFKSELRKNKLKLRNYDIIMCLELVPPSEVDHIVLVG